MSLDSDGVDGRQRGPSVPDTVEQLLLDSLIHHLIEKGVMTKNDALSVVQTAAEVIRGQASDSTTNVSLARLERLYLSFDAIPEGRSAVVDGRKVRHLRPPLHGDVPRFPPSDSD